MRKKYFWTCSGIAKSNALLMSIIYFFLGGGGGLLFFLFPLICTIFFDWLKLWNRSNILLLKYKLRNEAPSILRACSVSYWQTLHITREISPRPQKLSSYVWDKLPQPTNLRYSLTVKGGGPRRRTWPKNFHYLNSINIWAVGKIHSPFCLEKESLTIMSQ